MMLPRSLLTAFALLGSFNPVSWVIRCLLVALLTGCTLVPNDGPLASAITSEKETKDGFVYGLINLDAKSVASLSDHAYLPLESTFGYGHARQSAVIGRNDVLDVIIFEAGPDGIFSTQEKKSVALRLTVQGNGRISVPFAGTVPASGRTIEQVRRNIIASLRSRAVEPDVIVNIAENNSGSVVVNGAVKSAQIVPLVSGGERVLDVIGAAGGPDEAPYDTYVTLSRGGKSRTVLLQTLVDRPRENIFVEPGDALFLTYDPRVFLAFGAVEKTGRHEFNSAKLSLLEGAGVAGGLDPSRANPEAYFVFRYEYAHVVSHMVENHKIDATNVAKMLENPHVHDKQGRLPIIYKIDLGDADNFFVAKRFPMRADDMIYVARSGSVDFARVLTLFTRSTLAVRSASVQ